MGDARSRSSETLLPGTCIRVRGVGAPAPFFTLRLPLIGPSCAPLWGHVLRYAARAASCSFCLLRAHSREQYFCLVLPLDPRPHTPQTLGICCPSCPGSCQGRLVAEHLFVYTVSLMARWGEPFMEAIDRLPSR
jgi:hypothetical protein